MKAKVITKPVEKKFEPLTMEVTFETMDECLEMFARLNVSGSWLTSQARYWTCEGVPIERCQGVLNIQSTAWENIGEVVLKHIREQA